MSFKSSLIKAAIKLTPDALVLWVANTILKDIAELSDFNFDLDARSAYVRATLVGETDPIEVWVDDFGILSDEQSHRFIIQQAKSNKLWLSNILSRIVGKEWKIPELAQYKPYIDLAAEVLKTEAPQPEAEIEREREPEPETEVEPEIERNAEKEPENI